MIAQTRTRQVEVLFCWDDHTWTTEMVDVPAWSGAPPDDGELSELVRKRINEDREDGARLVYAGVCWIPNGDEQQASPGNCCPPPASAMGPENRLLEYSTTVPANLDINRV